MEMIKWVDQRLWAVPAAMFVVAAVGLPTWTAASRVPVLLAGAALTSRQQVYSSLAGSSSALLGLALAAVAILAAYGPRPTHTDQESRRESALARARVNVVGALLATSFFLLVMLVTTTTALAVDTRHIGNAVAAVLLETSSCASVLGLVVSGMGLALVVIERSQH